ncbi:MAG: HDOD domain-containing protein [Deltaproteobacteria bacterium]|nr:HDOD domain-containing protein [Deltaproteobacteria bacterium]
MDVYVARQPIFKKNKKICAYELLFRDGLSNVFPQIDGDLATSKVLATSFLSIGIEEITAGAPAFVNFPQNLLVKRVPLMFSPKSLVVEVLEDVKPEREVLRVCQELSQKGFQIALDDFAYRAELNEILRTAKFIKLDFRATGDEELKETAKKLASYPVSLLAEKVETYEEFEKALRMGFSYFQGYFFSKPEVLKAREISSTQMNLLQIMAEANKEDFDFGKLEAIIMRDVAISYKLMKYVNSAYFRRLNDISSIRQAIVLLGERQIRRFLSLIAMSRLSSDKPDELIRCSITRAKFCELLGNLVGSEVDSSELFTLGLFSLIDAIMDNSMEQLMGKLPLSASIKDALVSGKGRLSEYLRLVIGYERADWEKVSECAQTLSIPGDHLPAHFTQALAWADAFSGL